MQRRLQGEKDYVHCTQGTQFHIALKPLLQNISSIQKHMVNGF